MTTWEKMRLLDSYDDIPQLSEEHFKFLKKCAYDRSGSVRWRVPNYLLDFINEDSKSLLFRLARDKKILVRLMSYDALGGFLSDDVEQFLRDAITDEVHTEARSYAILSWIDIVVSLNMISDENISFLKQQIELDSAERCVMVCCYGLCRFGEKMYLNPLLSFLQSCNFRIRYGVIDFARLIKNQCNRQEITEAITELLRKEEVSDVKENAEILLRELKEID